MVYPSPQEVPVVSGEAAGLTWGQYRSSVGFPAERKKRFLKISHFSRKIFFSRPFRFVFAFRSLQSVSRKNAKFS